MSTSTRFVAPDFAVVSKSPDGERLELPVDAEDGTLSIYTLRAAFPGAHGLKYKPPSGPGLGNSSFNYYRTLRVDPTETKFYPPVGGWRSIVPPFIVLLISDNVPIGGGGFHVPKQQAYQQQAQANVQQPPVPVLEQPQQQQPQPVFNAANIKKSPSSAAKQVTKTSGGGGGSFGDFVMPPYRSGTLGNSNSAGFGFGSTTRSGNSRFGPMLRSPPPPPPVNVVKTAPNAKAAAALRNAEEAVNRCNSNSHQQRDSSTLSSAESTDTSESVESNTSDRAWRSHQRDNDVWGIGGSTTNSGGGGGIGGRIRKQHATKSCASQAPRRPLAFKSSNRPIPQKQAARKSCGLPAPSRVLAFKPHHSSSSSSNIAHKGGPVTVKMPTMSPPGQQERPEKRGAALKATKAIHKQTTAPNPLAHIRRLGPPITVKTRAAGNRNNNKMTPTTPIMLDD